MRDICITWGCFRYLLGLTVELLRGRDVRQTNTRKPQSGGGCAHRRHWRQIGSPLRVRSHRIERAGLGVSMEWAPALNSQGIWPWEMSRSHRWEERRNREINKARGESLNWTCCIAIGRCGNWFHNILVTYGPWITCVSGGILYFSLRRHCVAWQYLYKSNLSSYLKSKS